MNTCALACTQRNAFFSTLPQFLAQAHTRAHADTEWHQPSKVIYLTLVNVSMFYGAQSPSSAFLSSLTHTPHKTISFNHHLSPSSPSLSLPSSTVNHSFPFPPSLALLCYISLLYQTPLSSVSLSFSASHPSPGVFLGDQSSSSQHCHTIGSS